MPPDKPTPTVEQFARELVGIFEGRRQGLLKEAESGDGLRIDLCVQYAERWNVAINCVLDLAAAHGVNIEEGGE